MTKAGTKQASQQTNEDWSHLKMSDEELRARRQFDAFEHPERVPDERRRAVMNNLHKALEDVADIGGLAISLLVLSQPAAEPQQINPALERDPGPQISVLTAIRESGSPLIVNSLGGPAELILTMVRIITNELYQMPPEDGSANDQDGIEDPMRGEADKEET